MQHGIEPLTASLVRAAASRSERSMLSYRDALIVETALEAGAVVLMSEDMQDGQEIDGMTIRNPFS